jgi:D-3-phosphoglycerate dehydrogenase
MAVEQLKLYLEHGVVRNSVNFPAVNAMPSAGTKTRLVVINRDVPNMIANITKVLGDAGVNIQSFKNESNGKIGYNLVDLATEVSADLVEKISKDENVLKVRVIQY